MITLVRRLLGLIRFSHTIFALPFAFLSAALAWADPGQFHVLDCVGILLGMVLARSAAMAFNRLVDRRIDAENPRTRNRHLPTGQLSVATVAIFTLITAVAFVASTTLFLFREPPNPWPLYCAVPVLLFVLMYSLTKRFTSLAHFWLGASLMLAPVAAWIAIKGMTEMETPLILGLAVMFWTSGFDILYACQDFAFDQAAGLHSIPARLGIRRSLRLAAVCHAIMFGLLIVLQLVSPHLGLIYLLGLIPIGLLLAYEHIIVSPDDLTRVNQAFFQVNSVISIGLLVLVVVQIVAR